MKVDDRLALPRLDPVVARLLAVVLVDAPVAVLPRVKLATSDPEPADELLRGSSVRSDQAETKSTTSSRVSGGTQCPFRAPKLFS